jgi:cytochrome oxidase Cu insertion factor (SCO1/SenC/PrrC family)
LDRAGIRWQGKSSMKPFVQPSRRGKWVVLAIAGLFLVGIGAAFALLESGWLPGATKNYGELVERPRPVPDVAFADAEGRSVHFGSLKGKWTLLYFGSAECLKACTENLYKMRQVAAAQGRDAHRVQRVFVVTDARARDVLRYTIAEYPGTHVLFGSAAAVRELASPFGLPAGTPLDGLDRIYVVDPLGNFMMSYPADADPRGMNKDLKLLLRASQIG